METLDHHYIGPIDTAEAETLVEVWGIYDGWSIALMKDGRALNRWEPGTRRHLAAEAWIRDHLARQAAGIP